MPIEMREEVPDRATNVDAIGVVGDVDAERVQALEAGRIAARDTVLPDGKGIKFCSVA